MPSSPAPGPHRFEIVEVPPLPPGQSPFHVRGVVYDRVVKTAAATPGGLAALITEIKDPRIREFAGQSFKWSEWYDALPMVPMQAALCRLQGGGDFEELVRRRARAAGEDLVPRIFRAILRLGSPKAAAEHLPRLLGYYYDFVETTVSVTDTQGTGVLKHVPRIVAPGFVNTALGLIEGGLHLMGAKLVTGSYSDVTKGTPLHGFETVDCRLALRWVK